MKRKIILRTFFALIGLVLLAGILAPYLDATQFHEHIRNALQAALNRKVEIGKVHFNLFTGPGFTVEDVLIGDDATAGIEPFAHVETLQARLRLTSLFTGKLAFSKLRLVDPSVNLVKTDAGAWNIQSFFQRSTLAGHAGAATSAPDIQITDGRINFKFGLLKSVFYINNADVTIYPNSAGDMVVDFSGEPYRTDRGAQGFGRFSARGLLRKSGRAGDVLEMALRLEPSALSELVRLFGPADPGVQGHVSANLNLSGPLSRIAITGDLNVADLHRWDLMPAQGEGWTVKCRGVLNLRSQSLELATTEEPEEKVPVALRFKATDFISAPKFTATMVLQELPAASLVQTARHMGVPLPDNVIVDGKVNGGIGFADPGGVQGKLEFTKASFKFPGSGSASIDSAEIILSDRKVWMTPSELTLDSSHTARIEAWYDADSQDFLTTVATELMTAADMKSAPARLVEAADIPVLADCRQGSWAGNMRYERKGSGLGEWSGNFDVENALIDMPGVAAPLRIASAGVVVDHGKVEVKNLRGRVGPVALQADYRFDPAGGPHAIRLHVAEADLEELEHLLAPTLFRKQGLLANLRLRRASIPEWLSNRDIDGTVQIKRLMREDTPVCALMAHLVWTGTSIQFSNVTCTQDDMIASGRITVNLVNSAPSYRIAGQVQNFSFRDGKLDLDGEFASSGTSDDLLSNASSKGSFMGRGVRFSPDIALRDISGVYQLNPTGNDPRLSVTRIQATDGVDTYSGQGASMSDGHFLLDLTTSGKKQVKLTGSLLPMHLTAVQ